MTADDEPPASPATAAIPAIWLVDGFNVLHASVLAGRDRSRWWSESRRMELLCRIREFNDPGAEIWVIFDGPGADLQSSTSPAVGSPHASVQTVFAPSADDWLVSRVRAAPDPSRVAVVTGDRQVAGRARHWGAKVVTPGEFMARCRREP